MSKKTTQEVKAAIAKSKEPQDTVPALLERQKPEIERSLPNGIDADRFARIVLTTVKANPKLVTCTPRSIIAGAMLAAQLGLEPGPLGLSYLVPYWNKHIKANEAQWQLGYRGAIELARRSGELQGIEARTVFQGDDFYHEYGLNPRLEHRPNWDQQGEPRLYYLIARFHSGLPYVRVAAPWQIEEHRKRSKAAENGPWVTDYEAMAWKTLVHMSKSWLPLSVEASQALSLDGAVVNDLAPNLAEEKAAERDVIDLDSEEVEVPSDVDADAEVQEGAEAPPEASGDQEPSSPEANPKQRGGAAVNSDPGRPF